MDKKSLNEEGITPELMNSFDHNKSFSPVQLIQGDEPVSLIRCANGFWVMFEFGKYLKDDKNKLIVIPEKEAKIGRARYLINFGDQIYEDQILNEVERLKGLVDTKLKSILPKLREVLVYSGKIEVKGLEAILLSLAAGEDTVSLMSSSDKSIHSEKVRIAKESGTDEMLDLYNILTTLNTQNDYNSLYIILFQDGLPLIGCFNKSESDILIKFFHRDKIQYTIESVQSHEHLYNVAKINIEKESVTI